MDPKNNNLDWFGNLRLQINNIFAEASAVIPQEPIQQARHQFIAVRDHFKKIYAEVLEDLPMFLSYGPEEDVPSYPEEEQEENRLPPLPKSNMRKKATFKDEGYSSYSDSDADSYSDSDTDSDSDSLGFSYESDSPSDWLILDKDTRVVGADWNMVE